MKKLLTIALGLCLFAAGASAQEIDDRAQYQFNIDRDLWYNSPNAAGLALGEMAQWRNVALDYGLMAGSFRNAWDPATQSSFALRGDMLMELGIFKVAADVNLEQDALRRCKFNTSLYEVDWDMPYFAAMNLEETFPMSRTRASFDIKGAAPLLLDDQLAVGVDVKFDWRTAARNKNLRSRYNSLLLEIAPSAVYAIDDENRVGLTVSYKARPASNSLAASEETPVGVAFLQGLGYYSMLTVGGDFGVGRIGYRESLFGADLQYNRNGDAARWLVDLSLHKGGTRVSETGTSMGSVDRYLTGAKVQGLFGENRNRKLTARIDYNLNYWMQGLGGETSASNNLLDGGLDYTIYTGADAASNFDFVLGGGVDFLWMALRRYTPDAYLKTAHITPYVFLGKNIHFSKESDLLVKLHLAYNFAAGSDYKYLGSSAAGNVFVNYMYDNEVDYLSYYYLRTVLDAAYTYRINSLLKTYASARLGNNKPMGVKGTRLMAELSVGVMF